MSFENMKNGEDSGIELTTTGEKNLSDNVLHHYWHAVARSQELTDKPLAVKSLDYPVVLWRSPNGVSAFHDLCIHRGTPLSLGWIGNGQLICAYHGWQYGADGTCTHIPSIPVDRGIPAKARAVTYQATEKYGLVWVCLKTPVPKSLNCRRRSTTLLAGGKPILLKDNGKRTRPG